MIEWRPVREWPEDLPPGETVRANPPGRHDHRGHTWLAPAQVLSVPPPDVEGTLLAEWLRAHCLAPSGARWRAARAGERDLNVLVRLRPG